MCSNSLNKKVHSVQKMIPENRTMDSERRKPRKKISERRNFIFLYNTSTLAAPIIETGRKFKNEIQKKKRGPFQPMRKPLLIFLNISVSFCSYLRKFIICICTISMVYHQTDCMTIDTKTRFK